MSNKEIILQTALKLFGEQGYDRTPTSQIAREAGVSEGLIFRHYASKEGLLKAIIRHGMSQIADSMSAYLDQSGSPRRAVIQHIERSLNSIRENETFWRLATSLRFQAGVNNIAGNEIEEANQFIIKHLTDNFRKIGTDTPEQQALLLFAQIDGICLHWLQNTEHYPLEKMKQLLIKQYNHVYF
jgi:AcrR family transcriptional regulator